MRIRALQVRVSAVFVSLMVLAVMAGCFGGDSDDSVATPAPTGPAVAALQIRISHDRVQEVLDDPRTTDDIKAVLSDDILTFAEYEASVLAAIKCIKDAGGGVAAGDPRLNSRGLYTFVPSWPIEKPAVQGKVLACVGDHVGILDLFWKELVSPSAKDIADAMAAMALCMRDNGLGTLVPESMAPQDFQKIVRTIAPDESKLRAYVGCAKSAENEFGLIGFAPYTVDAP